MPPPTPPAQSGHRVVLQGLTLTLTLTLTLAPTPTLTLTLALTWCCRYTSSVRVPGWLTPFARSIPSLRRRLVRAACSTWRSRWRASAAGWSGASGTHRMGRACSHSTRSGTRTMRSARRCVHLTFGYSPLRPPPHPPPSVSVLHPPPSTLHPPWVLSWHITCSTQGSRPVAAEPYMYMHMCTAAPLGHPPSLAGGQRVRGAAPGDIFII